MIPSLKTSLVVVWLYYIVFSECMEPPQGSSSGGGTNQIELGKCLNYTKSYFPYENNLYNLILGFNDYNESAFSDYEGSRMTEKERLYAGGYFIALLNIALDIMIEFENKILEEYNPEESEYQEIVNDFRQRANDYYRKKASGATSSSGYLKAPVCKGRFKILSPMNFCLYYKEDEIDTCLNAFQEKNIETNITGADGFKTCYKRFVIGTKGLEIAEHLGPGIIHDYMMQLSAMVSSIEFESLPSKMEYCQYILS